MKPRLKHILKHILKRTLQVAVCATIFFWIDPWGICHFVHVNDGNDGLEYGLPRPMPTPMRPYPYGIHPNIEPVGTPIPGHPPYHIPI